jgi:hypothetical protein
MCRNLPHFSFCDYMHEYENRSFRQAAPKYRVSNIHIILHLYVLWGETYILLILICRSQWPHGLRRRSAAARLLRLLVRIPQGAWMFFFFVCCVLSSRGLCDELITRPEESYRLWCVVVCDLENLKNEEVMTRVGSQSHKIKFLIYYI